MSTVLEQHLTPVQIAKLWGMSPKKVRAHFEREPDVIKDVKPETRNKRGYVNLYIPDSAMRRVHSRLCRVSVAGR